MLDVTFYGWNNDNEPLKSLVVLFSPCYDNEDCFYLYSTSSSPPSLCKTMKIYYRLHKQNAQRTNKRTVKLITAAAFPTSWKMVFFLTIVKLCFFNPRWLLLFFKTFFTFFRFRLEQKSPFGTKFDSLTFPTERFPLNIIVIINYIGNVNTIMIMFDSYSSIYRWFIECYFFDGVFCRNTFLLKTICYNFVPTAAKVLHALLVRKTILKSLF
jgi:hypothetical protein